MFRKMMYLVSLIIVLGLVSGVKADLIDSFESGPGAWEIINPPETLAQSTEGVTDGTYSLERNFTAGFHFIDRASSNLIDVLNANETLEVDVTTSLTTEQVGTYLQQRIILQGGSETDNYYIEGPLISVASPDGTPTTTTVTFDYKAELVNGPLMNWAKIRLVNNSDGEGVVYYDNLRVVSPPPPPSITVIGDFEDGSLDNWVAAWDGSPVLANSTTGVTSGSGSLSLKTTGGYWALQWNAPTVPASLAGRKLAFDLTMVASEWPIDNWTKVADKIALNSDSADGWKEFTDTTAIDKLTGESVSLDWKRLSDTTPDVVKTYTLDISGYDLTGAAWLQINISVQGGDGQAHFYIDNVRLISEVEEPPDETPKSTDTIIGNWEQDLDNWVVGGGADVIFNDHNGVTLDSYSLDIYLPNGDWNQDVLTLSIFDNELLDAFKLNRKISVDVTRLVADWPIDDIPPWNNIRIILDAGGNNWSLWQDLGGQSNWRQTDGDKTLTATWDYGQYFPDMDFEDLTWLTLRFVSNANSEDYSGWVWFYLDNMIMFGGGSSLEPQPANGAIDVPIDSTLSWIAGPFAATHHVYLGQNTVKVNYADIDTYPDVAFAAVDEASFDPNELELDTQYFWRVDEVNEANPDSPWKGLVWSFTTANFLVVDDFEDYDSDENRIWYAWKDGLGYGSPDSEPYFAGNGTGSSVGDDTTPSFCEETIVHSGGKSMPLYFDNTGAAVISEAQRVWDEPQDWTWDIIGLNVMKLYVHGAAQNTPGELYLIVEDSAGVSGKATYTDSAIFTAEEWTEWEISLNDVAAEGLNLAAVKKLVIGISNLAGQAKASGILYIDDIQRHPPVVVSLDPNHGHRWPVGRYLE